MLNKLGKLCSFWVSCKRLTSMYLEVLPIRASLWSQILNSPGADCEKVMEQNGNKNRKWLYLLKPSFYFLETYLSNLQSSREVVRWFSGSFSFLKYYFKVLYWELPGSPVVKTLRFHCRGHRFNHNQSKTKTSYRPKIVIIHFTIRKIHLKKFY